MMKYTTKIICFCLSVFISVSLLGQNMKNQFFTWDQFVDNFGKEMVSAESVYDSMKKGGLEENSLSVFDFDFVSDKKENLERLMVFLSEHYPYKKLEITKTEDNWRLNGETDSIPITSDNLMFWALDMYKRGYEFDATLEGYGAPFNPEDMKFPDFDSSKADYYFDEGIAAYNAGNLSGALINWSNAIVINPKDVDALYSRAIVKAELHTWKAALQDYDKAIEIAPNFISAILNRGSVKDENGDYEGAIADYNKVIDLSEKDLDQKAKAYFNRGNTNFNQDDTNGACVDWKMAKELGADYANERLEKYCK